MAEKYKTISSYKRKTRDPTENKVSAKKAVETRWAKYRAEKRKLKRELAEKKRMDENGR